jgi:predicted dehydrogenase
MLDEAALDAVIIATPDHHHVQAAMLACHAGLDVYCEKPLTLTVAEGQRLIQAVRNHRRVLQVGSQQRSMEMDRFACQFVRDGKLGRVSHVELPIWASPLRYQGLPEEPLPEGMEWELFCGPTELRPYNWRLWQKDERNWEGKRWRGWDVWRDYSGHLVTNWGAHAVDMAQWALGMDASGPVEVEPLAGRITADPRTCPMVARYATGTELRMTGVKGLSAGGLFHGERGRIAIDRNRFRADPPDLVTDPPDPAVAEIWQGPGIVARPHLQNWFDCIKSRAEPNAPVEVGHRTVTICHLFNIARELRRQIKWDPDRGVIVGDDEAAALLDRPRRIGWGLPSADTSDKAGTDK